MNINTGYFLFKAALCLAFVPFETDPENVRVLLSVAALSAFFAAPLFAILARFGRLS